MASRHPSLEAYLSLSTGAARLPPPRPVAYIHQEKRGNKVGVAFLQEGIDTSKTVAYREEKPTVWLSGLPSKRVAMGSAGPYGPWLLPSSFPCC